MFFEGIKSGVNGSQRIRIAVAGARGEDVFTALRAAEAFADALLVGRGEEILTEAQHCGLKEFDIAEAGDDAEAARLAVAAVRDGQADVLMKGKVSTGLLMKAVLAEKAVFVRGRLLSHLAVMESPEGRVLGITDGGMNIAPGLDEKQQILESAVEVFHSLGVRKPKAAVLTAMEKENPRIPGSLDAAALSRLQDEGVITGCVVDGPIALDLAVVPEACRLKDYRGKIQGDADILLAPDLSAGNILVKSLIHFGGWQGGGLIAGSRQPIILLSRSDSAREKFNSILLAAVMWMRKQAAPDASGTG